MLWFLRGCKCFIKVTQTYTARDYHDEPDVLIGPNEQLPEPFARKGDEPTAWIKTFSDRTTGQNPVVEGVSR